MRRNNLYLPQVFALFFLTDAADDPIVRNPFPGSFWRHLEISLVAVEFVPEVAHLGSVEYATERPNNEVYRPKH